MPSLRLLVLGDVTGKTGMGAVKRLMPRLVKDREVDFVIATGEVRSVREFLEAAFSRLDLDWKRHVRIDPRYFRPSEVDLLLGDPTKARTQLGWKPKVSFQGLVKMMVEQVKAETAIVEGEGVAVDAETGEMKPFQTLMQRRQTTHFFESLSTKGLGSLTA